MIDIDAIDLDASIQCRAAINTATVNEYAERMRCGDIFPEIVLFGSRSRAWIGDGWHRTMAYLELGIKEVRADIRPGGRIDALKHALKANALHGLHRSNEDKRRCVEIALREFPSMSSRAVAEMCGVGHTIVDQIRSSQVASNATSPRTGSDGKHYPSTGSGKTKEKSQPTPSKEKVVVGPPCLGLRYASIAILNLESIPQDDSEREQAFAKVKGWLSDHGA